METLLHQTIKRSVARDADSIEVSCGTYRIDAIDDQRRLVEVQYGPLGALRGKILELRTEHSIRIIKPIAVEKRIVTHHPKTQAVLRNRKSPKRENPLSIFEELLHFTSCFPHPNLQIECWLVKLTEHRIDRPPRRRRSKPHRVLDVTLDEKVGEFTLRSSSDLVRLLGNSNLSKMGDGDFCTKGLAESLQVARWFAQQIAYVLYRCGAAHRIGKRGNSHLYRWHEDVRNTWTNPRIAQRNAA